MPLSLAKRARLQATVACVGALVFWWRIGGIVPALVAVLVGSLALLAWLSPAHYAPVQRALDGALHALLAVLTWLLLAVIYFGVFTPLRAWRSLRRSDPLQLQPDSTANTFFRPLPSAHPARFDRQF